MLDLDLDNLIAYCPYCGNKILIDVEQLVELLTEREKTKQQAQEQRYLLEKAKLEAEQRVRSEKKEARLKVFEQIWNTIHEHPVLSVVVFFLLLMLVVNNIKALF